MTSTGPGRAPETSTSSDQPLLAGAYTAHRLQHASPEHLHITTRRCFIGPIPEGWLKSHRKSWYKHYLRLSNYSSRAATFSASSSVSHQRQITGLDGPSASAAYRTSFPQPNDVDAEDSEEDDGQEIGSTAAAGESVAKDLPGSKPVTDDGLSTILEPESIGIGSYHDEYVGEHTKPKTRKQKSLRKGLAKKRPTKTIGGSSYVTAPEYPSFSKDLTTATSASVNEDDTGKEESSASAQVNGHTTSYAAIDESDVSPSFMNRGLPDIPEAFNSTSSLLPHERSSNSTTQGLRRGSPLRPIDSEDVNVRERAQMELISQPASTALVRFDIPTDGAGNEPLVTSKEGDKLRRRGYMQRLRPNSTNPGEIIKMEKMLVRVDTTMSQLPVEYDENDSLKTESRIVDKWREYVVVCRKGIDAEADFLVQMYKSRAVPAREQPHVEKRPAHRIPFSRKTARVNLYSSLDKTVVIWIPWKSGTRIFILRPRSATSSVEWYTFLRTLLGSSRTKLLQVNVPDLGVSLQLKNPFQQLEASHDGDSVAKASDANIIKTMEAEKVIAHNIVQRCLKMLEDNPEWANVLGVWLEHEKMGLAWKRYDRLEWVHGANERKMYGTMAMLHSHELELRPKQHYPTSIKPKGEESLDEPAAIEGFLIRLTSQKGRVQRLGKMYFKRLYFYTHNQYLCYCRPAQALPPRPPEMSMTGKVPAASQIVKSTPLIYAVNPYPLTQGDVKWLRSDDTPTRIRYDQDAYDEAERKVNTMLQAEGYINLCHVVEVRNAQRGSSPVDADVDEGPDVDFHQEVADTRMEDGKTTQFDEDRTFELVLKNGLVARLQAYNKTAKKEWIVRLRKLVKYWKQRISDDMELFKMVRQWNLKRLDIDEEMESWIGQYARKWEVTRSEASPQLYNMCGISWCRTIAMSGVLYRKPQRHSTFLRCGVILCHGQLLIFQGTLRERTGKEIPHIHHERQAAIDLKDCYIYSGLITGDDLLYQNQTFDSNHPGHHALPRVYLEDGWTSQDEDTMTCFVIWRAMKRSLFKATEEQGDGKSKQSLRYGSRLGVTGRSIVFKSRSRAERDHWVMAINTEIERLQQTAEIRVVP